MDFGIAAVGVVTTCYPKLQMEISFFPFSYFLKLTGCGSKSVHEFAMFIYLKIYEFPLEL